MVVAIHTNLTLAHQASNAEHLRKGFARHGVAAEVTPSPTQAADMHVVLGPHYAKQHWLGHPRVILLDRAYYRTDPEHVSLGWMRADGGRRFYVGAGREEPVMEERPSTGGTIFLADYGGPIEPADTVRRHPADEAPTEPLRAALRRHRKAVGYGTTALVAAALAGLEIVCKDARNILAQSNWLELLPYADWHWSEIESGEAWDYVKGCA